MHNVQLMDGSVSPLALLHASSTLIDEKVVHILPDHRLQLVALTLCLFNILH